MTLKSMAVATLAILAAAVTASCDRGRHAPTFPDGAANAAPEAPSAICYEDHVWAGGVPPPGGEFSNPHTDDAQSAKFGERLFTSMNCDGCHGGGGSGFVGPSLVDGRWRYGGRDAEIFNSIFYGRPKGMPAYGGVVGRDGVWMLVNYLKSLPVPDVVPTQSWVEPSTAASHPNTNGVTAAASQMTGGDTGPTPAGGTSELDALMQKDGCAGCHAVKQKIVGPAFRDIAAKYRGQPGAEQRLVASATNGSVGVWGSIPMPPNFVVNDDELYLIVKQVLLLK